MGRNTCLNELGTLLNSIDFDPIVFESISYSDPIGETKANAITYFDAAEDPASFEQINRDLRGSIPVVIVLTVFADNQRESAFAANDALEKLIVALLASENLNGSVRGLEILSSAKEVFPRACKIDLQIQLTLSYAA